MNKKEKEILEETENTIKKINKDHNKTKQIIISIDLITQEYHIFKVSKEKYKYTNKHITETAYYRNDITKTITKKIIDLKPATQIQTTIEIYTN